MKNNNLINKSYFMAGLLSNSFFISEILFNLLYQIQVILLSTTHSQLLYLS